MNRTIDVLPTSWRIGLVYIFILRYVSPMLAGHRTSIFAQVALALVIFVGGATAARSVELVMFEQPFCAWCEVWEDEVGILYSKTAEGKRIPIRKVDIHDDRPADLRDIKPVIFTPTFVLIHNGAEIGRILGYPGEDHFWGLLNQILERLPADG